MIFIIPIAVICAALLLSLLSGTLLPQYGARAALHLNGCDFRIDRYLTEVGISRGDIRLQKALPQPINDRERLFTVAYDRVSGNFLLETEPEQLRVSLLHSGEELRPDEPCPLFNGDVILVRCPGEDTLRIGFTMGGGAQ